VSLRPKRIDVVEDVGQILISQFADLYPAPVPVAHLAQRCVVFRGASPFVAQRFNHRFHDPSPVSFHPEFLLAGAIV